MSEEATLPRGKENRMIPIGFKIQTKIDQEKTCYLLRLAIINKVIVIKGQLIG
jgi:hypothetical protein